MAGFKEAIASMGVTIQPTPGLYNEPGQADIIPISAPDDGSDAITGDDPTLSGTVFSRPRQFLGRRGRAGATAVIRGPGGAGPVAGAWPLGRILQGAAFTEIVNAAAITGTAQAGGTTSSILMAAGSSSIDDFYKGLPIQHAGIDARGGMRGTSLIRAYNGTTKAATLSEVVAAAIANGDYTIPPSLSYVLSTGASIPLLSCKVWRHKKARKYRDCAINSFALNIPVSNDNSTDLPTIEFAMVGVPVPSTDEATILPTNAQLLPAPPAKAGKFTFAGLKLGHQTLRLEFTLETGALPNQNFDAGQEGYELLSGSRAVNLDLNEQLMSQLDIDSLVDAQTAIAMQSAWGQNPGNRFIAGVPNMFLDPFNPTPRNGFVGVSGTASPSDIDRSVGLSCIW